ncbi:MAG TPA: CFI-box-CTERM domain-containing protein [Niastella sp.]
MTHFKTKPASLVGAPISAEECRQLKAAFEERYPDQIPAVFLSREIILSSIQGLSNVSGIQFNYGLDNADEPGSRRIILVPTRNRVDGESSAIRIVPRNGYVCENGERVNLDQFFTLLGNHVNNIKRIENEIALSRLPKGYFWGIKKVLKLLEVEKCAGLVFHFGYNPAMPTAAQQFQNVLEVVDDKFGSLNVFMEYGQCACCIDPNPCTPECLASIAAEKYLKDADSKLDVLRAFRDSWLLQQKDGHALYEMYYFLSPNIVAEIQYRPNQDVIWENVYNDFSKCLDLIKQNKYEEVKAYYINLMHSLANRFLLQETEVEAMV